MTQTRTRIGIAFVALCLFASASQALAEEQLVFEFDSTRDMPARTLILNANDRQGDIVLQFGRSLSKTLTFDRTRDVFRFNDDVWISGTASGTIIHAERGLSSSGTLVFEGAASGSSLYLGTSLQGAGLSDCDTAATSKLLWDTTTGRFSCGTDQSGGTFGSGNVLTLGDNRYVKKSGDTMTGTLVIQNGNTHTPTLTPVLNVRGTMSGQAIQITGTGGKFSPLLATDLDYGAVLIGTGSLKNTGSGVMMPQLSVAGRLPVAKTGSGSTGTYPGAVAVQGRYAYVVSSGSSILDILDISPNAKLRRISSTTVSTNPYDIAVQGNLAYIVGASGNMDIYDVHNPAAPKLVNSYALGLSMRSISVQGRYAYFVNPSGKLVGAIDIGNPKSPAYAGGTTSTEPVRFIKAQGSYLYVTAGTTVVQQYDIGKGTIGTALIRQWQVTNAQMEGISIQGRYAYVTDRGNNAVHVIDTLTADGISGIPTGTVDAGATPIRVIAQGRYVYVTTQGGNTLEVFDVSNTSRPFRVGTVASTAPMGLAIQGRTAVVTNTSTKSISTFDLGGEYVQQLEAGGIEAGTVSIRGELDAGDASFRGGVSVGQSFNVGGNGAFSGALITMKSLGVGKISPVTAAEIVGTVSGSALTFMGGASYILGNTTIGSSAAADTKLEVIGTVSGSMLYAQRTLASSGTLVFEGAASGSSLYLGTSLQGAGLIDCDTASTSKLLWDSSTGRFSCGTDQNSGVFGSGNVLTMGDNRYVKKAGDTMTGALNIRVLNGGPTTQSLNVAGLMSGATIHVSGTGGKLNPLLTTDLDFGALVMGTGALRSSGTGRMMPQLYVAGRQSSTYIGSGSLIGSVTSFDIQGNYSYVINTNAFDIFDITNPTRPQKVSTTTQASASDIAVEGNFAYVSGGAVMSVYDVRNPSSPALISRLTITGNGRRIDVQGGYAYIANSTNGSLQIIDISNPAVPVLAGTLGGLSFANDVVVEGKYAYIASDYLSIIDVSNPTTPVLTGNRSDLSGVGGIKLAKQGRYVYVVGDDALFSIFDVINPASSTLRGQILGSGNYYGISVQGRYAYVTEVDSSLLLTIDITNDMMPIIIARTAVAGSPREVVVQGRYAHIGNTTVKAYNIYDLGGTYSQVLEAGTAQVGTLDVRDRVTANDGRFIGGVTTAGLNVSGDASFSGSMKIAQGVNTASGNILFSRSGSVVFNEQSRPVDFRVEGDTDANLMFFDASTDRVGIGTNLPDTKLEVIGTVSGSMLYAQRTLASSGTLVFEGAASGSSLYLGTSLQGAGLSDCDTSATSKLLWDATTGRFSCGTDQSGGTFGSGNVLTLGDNRYVKKAGDTMTGTLVIQNGNTHTPTTTALLNIRGTMSGQNLYVTGTGGANTPLMHTQISTGRVGIGVNKNSRLEGKLNVFNDGIDPGIKVEYDTTGASVGSGAVAIMTEAQPGAARNITGLHNALSVSYDKVKVTGVKNEWNLQDDGQQYGFANVVPEVGGNVQFLDGSNTFTGLYNRFSAGDYTGTNPVFFGTRHDIATDNEGTASETVYGTYAAGTTYSQGTDVFYGNYVTSSGASTGGTQYGYYADFTGGTASKVGLQFKGEAKSTMSGSLGIKTVAPKAALHVVGSGAFTGTVSGSTIMATTSLRSSGSIVLEGTLSGASVYGFGLNTDCDTGSTSKLLWDATTGRFSCGTDQSGGTFGSGNVLTLGDNRYVMTAGDTMTGALTIRVTGGGPTTLSLRATGTMSGAGLFISGTGSKVVQGTNSGAGLLPLLSTDMKRGTIVFGTGGLRQTGTGVVQPQLFVGTRPSAVRIGSGGGLQNPGYVTVQGKYAYVLSSGNSTLVIFDVSNATNPVRMGSSSSGLNAPVAVAVQGKYAYVASNANGTLAVFDVSNPAAPLLIATTTTELQNPEYITVQGRYVYMISNGNDKLVIFDVGNPYQPTRVGSLQGGMNGAYDLDVEGRYAYAISSNNNTLMVIDVNNPASPLKVGSVTTGLNGPVYMAVQGRYAYVTSYTNRAFVVFDVGTPTAPVMVGSVSAGLYGPWSVADVQGKYVYITDYDSNSIVTIDVSNPSQPKILGTAKTDINGPYNVDVQGRYAYVASYSNNSLKVFDLGGAYVQQLEAGGAEIGDLSVNNNADVFGNLDVRGGISAGAGITVSGPSAIASSSTGGYALTVTSNSGGLRIAADGNLNAPHLAFGTGSTFDAKIWRSLANRLQTNSSFYVQGTLSGAMLTVDRNAVFAASGVIITSSGQTVFNEQSRAVDFRIEGDTDANLIFLDASTDRIGVGTNLPDTKLEVIGTVSGSMLYAQRTLASSGTLVFEGAASGSSLYLGTSLQGAGLSDCDTAATSKLLWDATTGRFSCGTDQSGSATFGSGNVLTLGDNRYVKKAGDTMTGALAIRVTGGGPQTLSLRSAGMMSGATLFITGTGTTRMPLISARNGRVGIGTDAMNASLTFSGSIARAGNTLWTNGGDFRFTQVNLGFSGSTNYKYSAVLGGVDNFAASGSSVIAGGQSNTATGALSAIVGGRLNQAGGLESFVGGGAGNQAHGWESVVVGGNANYATGDRSAIVGGNANAARGGYSFLGAGQSNTATGAMSAIVGGENNIAGGQYSFIGGGYANIATGQTSTVGGGESNNASAQNATVAGGGSNKALKVYATVGGGGLNSASGQYATVPGGRSNIAGGDYSFAGGQKVSTAGSAEGTFIWGNENQATQTRFADAFIAMSSRVGLGTTDPKSALHVVGSGAFTETVSGSALTFMGGTSYVLGTMGVGLAGASVARFESRFSGGTAQLGASYDANHYATFTVDSSGDMGIEANNCPGPCLGADVLMSSNGSAKVGIGYAVGSTLDSKLEVNGTVSGALVTQNGAGNNYFAGNLGVAKTGTPEAQFEVQGTMSGNALFIARAFSGAGLVDCDTAATSKLLWDASTGRFSCGTDQQGSSTFGSGNVLTLGDNRYVKKAGDTMTGALNIDLLNTGNGTGLILRERAFLGSGATVSGSLVMLSRSDAPRAESGAVAVYAKNVSGKPQIYSRTASGAPAAFQPSFADKLIMILNTGGGTTVNGVGTTVTNDTTVSHPAPEQKYGYMTNFATAATGGDDAGTSSAVAAWFRGSGSGSNGLFFKSRIAVIENTSIRLYNGLADQTIATMVSADAPTGSHMGFQFSTARGDTTWFFETRDGSTQSTMNTGMSVLGGRVYDMMFYCTAQCTRITWRIENVTDGTVAQGTVAANLPPGGTALRMVLGVEAQAAAARNVRMRQLYLEAER